MLPELFFFVCFWGLNVKCFQKPSTENWFLVIFESPYQYCLIPMGNHLRRKLQMATTGDCLGYLVIVETHCQKDKTSKCIYDEELLLLMAAPQLCRPWKLFADYFAQNFTRIFKLHCAKSRSRLRLKMKIQNTILLSHLFVLIRYVNTLVNLVRGVILWHLCAGGTNFPWDQPISFGCGGVQRGNLEYIWHGNILEK